MPEPLIISESVQVPASAITVTAVRASGPGGQNVNKVSSKIDVRVDLAAIVGLDAEARARLRSQTANRLDAAGLLHVTSQKTRDQGRNLADACEKIKAMVVKAMVAPIKRKPTKPSRGAVRRRLADKKQTSERKKGRSTRPEE
ncbi:MAG: alternative ribosome rescue aminoacyl-tRNA hydrolase ArfB [Byssovorax sp.]|jgi:ribosome-associated protein